MNNQSPAAQRQINELAAFFGADAGQLTPAILRYSVFLIQKNSPANPEDKLRWVQRTVGATELSEIRFEEFVKNGSTNIPLMGAFVQFAIEAGLRFSDLDPTSMTLVSEAPGLSTQSVNALRRKNIMWLELLLLLEEADLLDVLKAWEVRTLVEALGTLGLSLR